MPPSFGSRRCSDGEEGLNMSVTAVRAGVSCRGKWTVMLPSACLLTGGFDHVPAFISAPLMVPVLHD